MIELDCNKSYLTTYQWAIHKCTSDCLIQILLDQKVVTTFSKLFIPAKTLPYGVYELKITVTMVVSLNSTSSSLVFVKILPSGIIVNLVQMGMSVITSGVGQDLLLDPGKHSINLDEEIFNTDVS
jgi:hypothetical protein